MKIKLDNLLKGKILDISGGGECEFDHVTAFYSLMYMTGEEQRKAIEEVFRVLKYNGLLRI